MHNPYYHPYPYYGPRRVHHPGLVGVLGGLINLTTATLQGGARVVRTIVEGTVWHGCHDTYGTCYHPAPYGGPCGYGHGHCYHVTCAPCTHTCTCCDC